MFVESGALTLVQVDYTRARRYRERHQEHRAPAYCVRYQLEESPLRDVLVGQPLQPYLIATIRESQPGDNVEVRLSEDGSMLLEWRNKTEQKLLEDSGRTWGESD